MILELTVYEQITLLGILEDIAQAEDVNVILSIQTRIAIKSIIQKLGGTYYGKLCLNLEDEYRQRVKDILSSFYGIQEDSNDGETI